MRAESIVSMVLHRGRWEAEAGSRDIRLFYVLDGAAEITVNDSVYLLKKEDMIVVNPGQQIDIETSDSYIAEFTINNSLLCRMMNYRKIYISCCSVYEKNDNFQELRRLIFQLLSAQSESEHSKLIFQKYSYEFLLFLIDNFSNNIKFESKEQKFLGEIRSYIESNYSEDISLEAVAAYFHYTPQYFSAFFKKNFKMTFLKYVHKIRLEYAKRDLLNSDETILKVALDNGFPNVASFSRVFQEAYGQVPSVFRQEHKSKPPVICEEPDEAILKEILKQSVIDTDSKKHRMTFDSGKRERLKPYWKKIWNLGAFSQLTDADTRAQVKILKDELDFECARVVLDLYERNEENPLLFYEEERVFDFLIDIKVDIMIVIEYRAYSRKAGFLKYLKAMIYNFLNRYGYSHVWNWQFELFYDSDFTGMKAADYARFYQELQQVLKAAGLRENIAGPGVLPDKKGGNVRRFLDKNPDLEMLTLSAAPYSVEHEDGDIFLSRNTDVNYLKNQIEIVREVLKSYPDCVKDVYVVNWRDALVEPDVMNDACYCAAKIIQTVINCYDQVDGLAWSVPLDILGKEPLSNSILTGSLGFLCRNGIRKPSFYAYAFLNKLDQYFVHRDAFALVTCDNERYYEIICHNCKKLNYKYYINDEVDLELAQAGEYYEDMDDIEVEIQVDAIPDGKYVIKYRSVSEEGSILRAWKGMNYFQNNLLGPDEMDYLAHTSRPAITTDIVQVENGSMNFTFVIKANEIKHIHIIPLHIIPKY